MAKVKVLSQNSVVIVSLHIFNWVNVNSGALLVGIRRISVYHVDYTTNVAPHGF